MSEVTTTEDSRYDDLILEIVVATHENTKNLGWYIKYYY